MRTLLSSIIAVSAVVTTAVNVPATATNAFWMSFWVMALLTGVGSAALLRKER